VNNKIIIPIIVGIIIVIIGIIAITNQETTEERIEVQWRHSGPFAIEKYEYYLGEKIFMTVQDIPKDVSGEVLIFRPTSTPNVEEFEKLEGISKDIISTKTKYLTIKFNGENKQNFNRYFEPSFHEWKGICSRNDLVGEWAIVFHGTQYENMSFKIINQTSSWDERTFETITNQGRC
jgi:hypothetical protein